MNFIKENLKLLLLAASVVLVILAGVFKIDIAGFIDSVALLNDKLSPIVVQEFTPADGNTKGATVETANPDAAASPASDAAVDAKPDGQ